VLTHSTHHANAEAGGPGDAFDAFVITNDATNFSVGANLMLLLMAVQKRSGTTWTWSSASSRA
jgi:hypothetical protein